MNDSDKLVKVLEYELPINYLTKSWMHDKKIKTN